MPPAAVAEPSFPTVFLPAFFLRISSWGAGLMLLVAIEETIRAVVGHLAGRTVPGWTSLMVILCLSNAAVLASVGILGGYVGRIYGEGRHRAISAVGNRTVPLPAYLGARAESASPVSSGPERRLPRVLNPTVVPLASGGRISKEVGRPPAGCPSGTPVRAEISEVSGGRSGDGSAREEERESEVGAEVSAIPDPEAGSEPDPEIMDGAARSDPATGRLTPVAIDVFVKKGPAFEPRVIDSGAGVP